MLYFFYFLGFLSLAYLALIFLTSPAGRVHPDREVLKGTYIAHRGLHNAKEAIPENSLLSFQKAIEKNLPIEIDIHLTKDGQIVVFHDENTERMCGVNGKIEEMTLDEIKNLSLLETSEKIPTLQEVLSLVRGQVFLLIEFKVVNKNTEKLCKKANEILTEYKGKYLVQSFYPQVLSWYKKYRKDICRGQLSAKFLKESLAKRLLGLQLLNFIGRPDFVSFKQKDASSLMFRFVKWQGAEHAGWTFRTKDELEQNKNFFHAWIFEGFDPKEHI